MDKPDLTWLGWAMVAYLCGKIAWHFLSRYVRNKTLRKIRTPFGAPIYMWKNPLGMSFSSSTHPGLSDWRGDGGDGSGALGDCGDGGD